jgi:hypothetical protein
MFLPPNALGGIPCLSIPATQRLDPHALALRMAAELPPPDLRIGMNPAKGLVRVPTWFWADGYRGGTLSESETVKEDDTVCHLVPVRTADGLAQLGEDGRPQTRTECTTTTTTFDVGVRLWPGQVHWDFGDKQSQDVPCRGVSDCVGAFGAPYVDAVHESSIKHPYVWSSLGVNGAADAYTVGLSVLFNADYRVSINGQDQGGWHDLPARTLAWSAIHQVQEAQAVLTRACPVTIARC